jgi:hypothetical protein
MVNDLIEILIELNLIQFNSIQIGWIQLKANSIQFGFNGILLIIFLSLIQPNYENSILRRHMHFHIHVTGLVKGVK